MTPLQNKFWRYCIMKDLYVVSCCRTAVGAFQGSLSNTPASDLGATVVKAAL